MTDSEYRKALLLTKIEAHRSILRLEVRCARATLNPWNAVLSFLGIDTTIATAVSAAVHAVTSGHGDGVKLGAAIVPLVVGALMPLFAREHAEEREGDSTE